MYACTVILHKGIAREDPKLDRKKVSFSIRWQPNWVCRQPDFVETGWSSHRVTRPSQALGRSGIKDLPDLNLCIGSPLLRSATSSSLLVTRPHT